MRRVLALALALSLSAGAAAMAQEAIPTAGGAQSNVSPKPPATDNDLRPHDEFADGPLGPKMGPCGPVETPDGKADYSPHGEVHAGVGTHGYRNIGGAICKPLGDNGAIAIAIDKTDGDYGYGRRYR